MQLHHAPVEPPQAQGTITAAADMPRLSDADLRALQAVLPLIGYEAGQPIFHFGDPGDTVYFIVSGKVRFFHVTPTGEEFTLEEAGTGSFFGEVAMLHSGKRTASAQAMEATGLLELHGEELDAVIQSHPHVARLLMVGMAQRLSRSGQQLRYATIRNANEVADEELTAQTRRMTRLTEFLGSGGFLIIFGVFLCAWILLTRWEQMAGGLEWLGLALSALQIVIGNFVLNSQHRTAVQERALSKTEYEANIIAEKEIRALHVKVEAQHSELLRQLKRLEKQQRPDDSLY